MRRAGRVALWALGVLLLLPVVLAGLVLAGLNTGAGQREAARAIASLTGGTVVLDGLSGRFPDALRLRHLEIHDARGAWLIADDVALDWSPTRLLRREALIERLEAARLQLPRLPESGPAEPAPAQPSAPFQLPVRVLAQRVHVDRAELGPGVLGAPAVLALDGNADVASLQAGRADIALRRLDGEGAYTLKAEIDLIRVKAALDAAEPDGGLVANLASLPGLGALRIQGSLDGPRTGAATALIITAGPLRAEAKGTLDLDNGAADLAVTGTAPAMTPRADVSWQAIDLQARVRGPFTAPDANGRLQVDGLAAAGAGVRRLVADIEGNAGRVGLHAVAEGLRVPGPDPAVLEAAPLVLDAAVRLDDPARPVTFTLAHPLLSAKGDAQTGGDILANVDLIVPDLKPLAALGGMDLQGRTALKLRAAVQGSTTRVDADGTLSITGGLAPAPGLVGENATLGVSAQVAGSDVTVTRAEFAGKALHFSAQGTSKTGVLDASYRLGLLDLAALAPTLMGAVQIEGTAKGATDALAVAATATGEVGAPGVPRGPVTLTVALQGLPTAPTGQVTAQGTLAGAPVALALNARREADGTLHATIDRADWRSLHAEGGLRLAPGATLPLGQVSLRMAKLDDLRPFIGQPLSGAVTAEAVLDADNVRLQLDAQGAGIPGSRVGRLALTAKVADPLGAPMVTAHLAAEGIDAGGATGSAKLDVTGPQGALAVRTTAALRMSGTDAQISGAATIDAVAKAVQLSAFQVAAKGETLRLLAPAQVRFADGVAVDRLRLGVRQAVLEVAGRLSPTLDATATLRTPADIASIVSPEFAADGTITLDAKLTGPMSQPSGTVRLSATGLRARIGPGRALPAANLTANAQLAGTSARVDARLAAGTAAQLTVTGQAPLGAGPLDLRAQGAVDLALSDPILTAAGRRARGRVQLDASVTGTAASPRVAGSATLTAGEIQDFSQGVRITGINASLRADGDTVRIVSFTGRAGPGTIGVTGTIGVLAPDLPVDLAIQLRNARPLASDRLTADLDGDLTVRGPAIGALQAGGRILIRRAEINIPERLPSSIAVLDVRRPGQKPPPPPEPPAAIGLDLTVDAPRAIFLRGRGVDAELAGSLRVRGSSAAPQVAGGFEMRRGTISVAGTTLTFTRGKVGFDGTGVTGKIDPTLDFVAESSAGNVTATLAIGGYASAPKITLSSVPELPQDEVLAYLLFKRSAKELGPFQIAEIAAAVASLTGVGGGVGNPLESVRRGLGLDRLSIGGGASGSAPTVEAGRYIGNGVYVGAKQGTTGAQTQATVQVDITKGLKLETDVGTGTGGNSVGLTYQFEY